MVYTYNYRRALPPMPRTTVEEQAIMADVLSVIPILCPRYTNRNPSDPGMMELRALARGLDNLAYYLNSRRLDVLIGQSMVRKSIFQIAAQIGYNPHRAAGARGTMRISLASPAADGVVLPKWWQCRTPGTGTQYYMALDSETVIPAGQMTVDAYAVQGQRYVERFVGSGQPGQEFLLSMKKVCAVAVDVENVDWSQVDDLVGADDDATAYSVRLAWDGAVTVVTGDGVDGGIVPAGAAVTITYLVTAGDAGNEIAAGTVTEAVDAVMDGATDVTATTTVSNLDTPVGGEDEESDDDIKRHAPRMTRTCLRCGPGNDWQTAFESYPGVERVQVVDLNNYGDPDDARYNYLTVYVVPSGGGTLNDALKAELQSGLVDRRREPGMDVIIVPAEYVTVDVTQTVYKAQGYTDADVLAAVTTADTNFFSPDPDIGRVNWMKNVDPDELLAEVDKLEEVSYVEQKMPASKIEIGVGQFPVLGALNITILEAAD